MTTKGTIAEGATAESGYGHGDEPGNKFGDKPGFEPGFVPANSNGWADRNNIMRLIKRYRVALGEAPPIEIKDTPGGGGLVIVTEDGAGVCGHVAHRLRQMGYHCQTAALPGMPHLGGDTPDSGPPDLRQIEAVVENAFTQAMSESGLPLVGFVHVSTHHPGIAAGIPFPNEETAALKSVFLCAKYFYRLFEQGAGFGFFVSAARIDGHLGLGTGGNAAQGGLFGLHKSLAIEWEGHVLSKAVDLSPDLPPEAAAECLVDEIFGAGHGSAEVGISADGSRSAPALVESYPEPNTASKGPDIGDVLLVTGGGRGITASCAIRLAETCRCGFVILGRTDISESDEWAGGATDGAELRRLAIAKITGDAEGAKPKPSEVDRLVNGALHRAEINGTLKAIRDAGGRARYISCDVRDTARLGTEIKACELELGPITGLVHGAGSIADKKIQRKTAEDFDNVFGSKITGLDSCLRCLDANRLKYLILFSSIAGYYGNTGQSDYAMANEVMSKFAHIFKKSHPACNTVSINWGMWDAGSMVSESIRNAIKGSELRLIPVEAGTKYFVDQLLYDQPPGECQIVISGNDGVFNPGLSATAMGVAGRV